MTDKTDTPSELPANAARDKPLTPEAQRALAEAEARRKAEGEGPALPKERGGRETASNGEEPTRFGDWEKDGRAVDF